MSENLLYIGSVIRAPLSEAAWRRIYTDKIKDPTHLITQLYRDGAVDISGALILNDYLRLSGSFSESNSIYEIIGRLSLVQVNRLATNCISPFSISEETYNSKPVKIELISVSE